MKQFLITTFLSLFCLLSNAQVPTIQWAKNLGGSNDELAKCIKQTTDGGYIIAGNTTSNDIDVVGNHGSNDFWVAKLTSTGSLQWQKTLGGSNDDKAYSVQQTTDGGYIVAGSTKSNDGDVTLNHNVGTQDFWVVKLSSIGNVEWQKSYGGTGDDYANSIIQTSDGGYVVCGATTSVDGDVTGFLGATDFWLIKLTSSGFLQWQKVYGGTSYEEAYCVQETTDGGFVLCGNTSSSNGNVTGNNGGNDYWVLKTSNTGVIQWQKTLGGSADEYAKSIQQTTDGGYIINGFSSSNNGNVSNNKGSLDYWVSKLNSTGTLQWQKTLGGSLQDYGNAVQQTTDGGYIVAGSSISNAGNVTGNHGNYDSWIAKLNNTGTIQWQQSYGGSNEDGVFSIQQTSDGGFILGGYTASSDGDVIAAKGGYDFWAVKLNPSTLPLKFISFTATTNCTTTTLNWQTANEVNNKEFVVEQSINGTDFTSIATLEPNTNNYYKHIAQVSINDLQLTTIYYRIKQIDNDGKFSYSEILKVNINCNEKNIKIYPNPVKNILFIEGLTNTKNNIVITNMLGETMLVFNNANQKSFNVTALNAGVYFIKINSKNLLKFIKE